MNTALIVVAAQPAADAVVSAADEERHLLPASKHRLYSSGARDESPQNNALFHAHELIDAAQLGSRMAGECNVHHVWQRQACNLLHALARPEDRRFFRQMCDNTQTFPFVLRYAWLWCRFANCDEDEINTVFPTGRGFVEESHDHCRAGIAASKQEIADLLLRNGPFQYHNRAGNLVRAAREAARRHAAPTVPAAKRAKTAAGCAPAAA
jgi:hypothetical protein